MFQFGKNRINADSANRLLGQRKITMTEYIEFTVNFLYQKAMPGSTRNVLKIKDMIKYGEDLPNVNLDGLNVQQICEVFRNLEAFQKAVHAVQDKLAAIDEEVTKHSLGYGNGHLGESTVPVPTLRAVADMIAAEMKKTEPEDLGKYLGLGDSLAKTMLRSKINISAATLSVVLQGTGAAMIKMIAAHKAKVD